MIERKPPKFAAWLLVRFGSGYQSESLAGDLTEQYQAGLSRAWYWRQVIAAISCARGRFIRALSWAASGRATACACPND
jgi:hypothetical protein